jgi:enamine deaminase RidA (YjgF/YER057c/UK114 family)
MTRRLISSGSPFERTAGYSRAVVEGEWVFVAGTTGFDYAAMSISSDLAEQVHQCFRNISAALKQAGAGLADVVRANYIVPRAKDWAEIAPILGQYFSEVRPASTAIVAGLVDSRMRIEIEVTARRRARERRAQAPRRKRG